MLGAVAEVQETMTPDRFTTRPLRARDQFEVWCAWYHPIFDVIPKQPAGDGFPAEIELWKLGGFAVSRTTAPPLNVVRSRSHLKRDAIDHWVISYCARGAHSATTAGISLEVPAKVPFLWSLGQEFFHERTHVDRIQIIMACDDFQDIAPLLDAALGSNLDAPLGHLLGDYMTALARRLPGLTETDLPRLRDAVAAMVGAAVAPTAERIAIAGRQIDLGRLERVRQVVRRHLRTPALGPATLCRMAGMSRSNLYRLLEEKGGVARYIRSQRLIEAHAVLSNPANTKSISALAEDLCFADASSFSRAFRGEFGASPSEVRSAALLGLAPIGLGHRRVSSEGADFGKLMHEF